MPIPVGQRIANRYEVLQVLTPGGQGEVYKVKDTYEDAVCVLKLLNLASLTAGPWDEAQILRSLSDDHILEIRNADVYAGQPYIVTALAEHGTLESELGATNGLGLDVDDVVVWIRQAAMGIARAHDRLLVHSDIKPANLFLGTTRDCLVGDFGLASRIASPTASGIARGGTNETVAPEVAGAALAGTPPPASVRSDVYGLGATAFWLLSGRPPVDFTGIPPGRGQLAAAATQVRPRLREVAPHVPAAVANVIDRAISMNPHDRHSTASEFSAALGSRSTKPRRWRRTNQHSGHLGCWVGEHPGRSTYVLCLEQGSTVKRCQITTRHATGAKVQHGSREAPLRAAMQAVRATMDKLS